MKAVVLVDGQHYLPVTKAALEFLVNTEGYSIEGLVFIGGMEKIGDKEDINQLGYPTILEEDSLEGISKAIDVFEPEVVIDLSDEPVVGYKERFKFANLILSRDVSYKGADFQFDPPRMVDIMENPSLSFIGTGKRIGKTAVTAYSARILKEKFNPCIVTMSRGGSDKPEVLRGEKIDLTPEYLVEVNDQGKHAASDHFEDAIMSRVTTIGSRRCGGGFAGAPYYSNLIKSARVANILNKDMILFEGSGSSIPPVKADAYILIIGANQPVEYIGSYMGGYRVLCSDLVILTLCEEPMAPAEKVQEFKKTLREIKPDVNILTTVFRPKPLEKIEGKKVYYTTTAPEATGNLLGDYLEKTYNCRVVGISHNLSNRKALVADMEQVVTKGDVDIILTEVKANSIKVAAKMALENDLKVVFCDNIPVCLDEETMSEKIMELGYLAQKRFRVSSAKS